MTNKNIIISLAVLVGILVVANFFFPSLFMKRASNVNQYPEGGPQAAKINVEEVCNGALAYMTFPDAASAEVFVKECKEGKYPEVIERYKANLNLNSDVQI